LNASIYLKKHCISDKNTHKATMYEVIHTGDPSNVEDKKRDFTVYVSIDPGIKNLAVRVEYRYDDGRIYVPLFTVYEIDKTRYVQSITDTFDEMDVEYPDYVIIEKQQNPRASTIMFCVYQHIISYFFFRCQVYDTKIIILSPKAKSKVFPTIKGKHKKKESIVKAIEITNDDKYKEGKMLGYKRKKQDDLADTVCQLEAYFELLKI